MVFLTYWEGLLFYNGFKLMDHFMIYMPLRNMRQTRLTSAIISVIWLLRTVDIWEHPQVFIQSIR